MSQQKRNTLSQKESYQLCQWLERNKELVENMTSQDVADLATMNLGFNVVQKNVRTAGKTVEITFKRSVSARKSGGAHCSAPDIVLAESIIELANRMNYTPRNLEGLMAIVANKTRVSEGSLKIFNLSGD